MNVISPTELKAKLDADPKKENFLLLDVREFFEYQMANINGTHIPLAEVESRLSEIEDWKEKEVICMCRSGKRSEAACQVLEQNGFTDVTNLNGGILGWAAEVDPSIPSY